jgi:hypothetical protein
MAITGNHEWQMGRTLGERMEQDIDPVALRG